MTPQNGSNSDASDGHRARRPRSVRLKLLLTVNLTVGGALFALLVADYQYELSGRLETKQQALAEEARTLFPAIRALSRHDPQAVQRYIDLVCSEMQTAASPGHHIAVRLPDGSALQAQSHQRASSAMLGALQRADPESGWRTQIDGHGLLVGRTRRAGITVYVSEYVTNLRQTLRRQVLWRLVGLAAVGILGALVVNLIFLRVVTRPLGQLVATVREIGAGRLGVQATPFNSAELDFLVGEINFMSQRLAEVDRERRLQLEKARKIQDHLRTARTEIPGLRVLDLHWPATEVAGDYHEVVRLRDGSWLLCIADVTGHGVPAAMGAATLKGLLLAAVEHENQPAQILSRVNRLFESVTLPEDFATMLLLRWDPNQQVATYASAGHETGYWITRDGAFEELTSTGILLGVSAAREWETRTLHPRPGDRLLVCTDGVSEARSPQGDMFGRERVATIFRQSGSLSLEVLMDRLRDSVETHTARSPGDDVTLLVGEVTETPLHTTSPEVESRVVV